MPVADLPPRMQERVVCSISAAAKYEVPANIILAIAEKEAGKPGQWVRNTNGTFDVGTMQLNTSYLKTLARYGITADDVAQAGCYPYDLAAWRIGGHIRHDRGDIWTRAANYHSRTPVYNSVYRADLMVKAARWADWLQARYATYDVLQADAGVKVPAQPTPAAVAPVQQPSVVAAADAAVSRPESRRPAVRRASWPIHFDMTGYVPRTIRVASNSEAQ